MSFSSFPLWPHRVGRAALTRWTRQMATLLAAGLPIDRALTGVAAYQKDTRLRGLSLALEESMRAGLSVEAAFASFPRQFDTLYRQVLASGEATGALADSFSQLADYRERADRARARLRRAAAYPAIVLCVSLAAVVFLLLGVVPTYQTLYAEFGATLPESTQSLLSFAAWLKSNTWWLVAVLVLVVGSVILSRGRRKVRLLVAKARLSLWPFSRFVRPGAWARVSRGLGSMLTAGVHLQDALVRAGELANNDILRLSLQEVADRVTAGESIAEALAGAAYVEPIVLQMASIGEETGRLGPALVKAAEFLEMEVDLRTETMLTLAEPFLVLFVGAVVGAILLALYLPLFDLVSHAG
jgi:type II secretory pathway component PulF